jgi:hypothetical protein
MMNRVRVTIRIPSAQEVMLKREAAARGLTRYQALVRAIEMGLAVMMEAPARSNSALTNDEIADVSARLALVEALADRGLFTASAAYVYARRAALRGDNDPDKTDAAMGEAAQAAYKRQRALAAERL